MSKTLRLDPRGLSEAGLPALIGVSGGRDSMALLAALHEAGRAGGLTICHLNHGWRSESGAEAETVIERARELGVAVVAEKLDPGVAKTELAARQARLDFFARVAGRLGCNQIYLAHHADDQVETVLWNVLRGSGTAGLAGMASESWQTVGSLKLRLLRPLLGTWRTEIDAYVTARALQFCEDASNAEETFTRNRLRNRVLPEIERVLGREVRRAIWRVGEIAAAEEEWMSGATADVDGVETLAVAEVRLLPLALQRRLLRAWLVGRGVANVDFQDVENVRELLAGGRVAKVNLSSGLFARRRAGVIFVESAAARE